MLGLLIPVLVLILAPLVVLIGSFDVTFFARVAPEKGVFDFLRVVANLVKWRRGIRALVMGFGSGDMAVRTRRIASELGIAGNVEFRFNVPRDEAMRLLAQSKLVIYPNQARCIPTKRPRGTILRNAGDCLRNTGNKVQLRGHEGCDKDETVRY